MPFFLECFYSDTMISKNIAGCTVCSSELNLISLAASLHQSIPMIPYDTTWPVTDNSLGECNRPIRVGFPKCSYCDLSYPTTDCTSARDAVAPATIYQNHVWLTTHLSVCNSILSAASIAAHTCSCSQLLTPAVYMAAASACLIGALNVHVRGVASILY